MLSLQISSLVKSRFWENPQIFQIDNLKIMIPLNAQQRLRPPPWWRKQEGVVGGSDQQDASAVQGTMRMLGAPISGGHSKSFHGGVYPWLWKLPKNLSGKASPRRARDSHKAPLAVCWRWRAAPFTEALLCWQPRGALRTRGRGIVTLASVEPVVGAAVTRLPGAACAPVEEGAQGGVRQKKCAAARRQKATYCCWARSWRHSAKAPRLPRPARCGAAAAARLWGGCGCWTPDGLNARRPAAGRGKPFPHRRESW